MISCEETGEINERPHPVAEPGPYEKSARLHVANETMAEVQGIVYWSLRGSDSNVITRQAPSDDGIATSDVDAAAAQGRQLVVIPPLSGVWLEKIDLADINERETHLNFHFEAGGQIISSGTCLFSPPKYYHFTDPKLTHSVNGKFITVKAKAYAKNVEISALDGEAWLSDNYFDMEAGKTTVEILRGDANEFEIRSVYDIGG
jgi:beta-mannosidase